MIYIAPISRIESELYAAAALCDPRYLRCPHSKDPGSLKRFKRTRLGAPDCLTATLPALMQSHHPRHASAAASGQCRNFSSFLIIAGATEQLGRVHLCNYNREHVTVVSGQQGWVG